MNQNPWLILKRLMQKLKKLKQQKKKQKNNKLLTQLYEKC
jgi:flagellar motor component MotA